jgi:hypothetical protein
MIGKQTSLDLNGPILSFVQQPQSVSVCDSESATFVGIATALFPVQDPPNPATNTGTLSYRWYADGFGSLTDGTFQGASITGSGTTTLTITNAKSPTANGLRLFVDVDYVPSAYVQPVGSEVNVGTARSTGNAINEVLNSNSATLTVFPVLSVATQPTDQTAAQTRTVTFTTLGALTDTTQGSISYRWQLNGNDLSDSSTVTGSQTTSLSISLPNVGTNAIRARLTHPTACNSPLFTNTVNFTVVSARAIINYENFGEGTPSLTGSGSVNLFNNPLFINADSAVSARSNSIYAPERDIRVRITMGGSRGNSRNGFRAGFGGVSTFEMTLFQNVEYVFKLGTPSGFGGPDGGANGGGGIAVMYRQANVLVVCGGGGGAGTSGRGGDGGGIAVAGERGQGRDAGNGGYRIETATLDMNGSFAGGTQSGPTNDPRFKMGGKLSKCTIGDYWRQRGFSPCQNMGNVQAFTFDGRAISGSTSSIVRGYKAGIGYRNNGGNGEGNEGGGGSGVVGGNAAIGSGSGGGGASGYSNGEVNIISTQLGGNDGFAFATIELIN